MRHILAFCCVVSLSLSCRSLQNDATSSEVKDNANDRPATADFVPIKITSGTSHTCALSSAGAIKCWGSNDGGGLGTADAIDHGASPGTMGRNLPTIDLGLDDGDRVTEMCSGGHFNCAVSQKGLVKCWGYNWEGQLGQGAQSSDAGPMGRALPFTDLGPGFKATSVACGAAHVCALSDAHTMKCWGGGFYGALGYGNTSDIGSTPASMGDHLPELNGLRSVVEITAGTYHTCALSTDGVRCWGEGASGALGLESTQSLGRTLDTLPGASRPIALASSPGKRIAHLSSGYRFNCALMKDSVEDPGLVKCWGENTAGALGAGDSDWHGSTANSMGSYLPSANLAMGRVIDVQAYSSGACALSEDGRVKCWGINYNGDLGLGDRRNRGTLPSDMGENLPYVDLGMPVKKLSVGAFSGHKCVILVNNQVKCWGEGHYGQLGYEAVRNIGDQPGQMGNQLGVVKLD